MRVLVMHSIIHTLYFEYLLYSSCLRVCRGPESGHKSLLLQMKLDDRILRKPSLLCLQVEVSYLCAYMYGTCGMMCVCVGTHMPQCLGEGQRTISSFIALLSTCCETGSLDHCCMDLTF